jgi:hypothetical protein
VGQLEELQLAGEPEVFGENLPQYHFIHHKSHMILTGIESGRTGYDLAFNEFSGTQYAYRQCVSRLRRKHNQPPVNLHMGPLYRTGHKVKQSNTEQELCCQLTCLYPKQSLKIDALQNYQHKTDFLTTVKLKCHARNETPPLTNKSKRVLPLLRPIVCPLLPTAVAATGEDDVTSDGGRPFIVTTPRVQSIPLIEGSRNGGGL